MKYCVQCGSGLADDAKFCSSCGKSFDAPDKKTCPKCGSAEIDVQVFQENLGSATKTKTNSKYKEKRHGCLWWLLIGWWWWFIELFLWIIAFLPMLAIRLLRKKKYKGTSDTDSVTINNVSYKTVCVCKNCGNHWNT